MGNKKSKHATFASFPSIFVLKSEKKKKNLPFSLTSVQTAKEKLCMHTSFLQTLLLSANSFKLWETSSEPEDLSSAWVSFLIKSSWGSGAATSHGSLRFVPVDIFVMLPLSPAMNYRNATHTGTSYLGVITPL